MRGIRRELPSADAEHVLNDQLVPRLFFLLFGGLWAFGGAGVAWERRDWSARRRLVVGTTSVLGAGVAVYVLGFRVHWVPDNQG